MERGLFGEPCLTRKGRQEAAAWVKARGAGGGGCWKQRHKHAMTPPTPTEPKAQHTASKTSQRASHLPADLTTVSTSNRNRSSILASSSTAPPSFTLSPARTPHWRPIKEKHNSGYLPTFGHTCFTSVRSKPRPVLLECLNRLPPTRFDRFLFRFTLCFPFHGLLIPKPSTHARDEPGRIKANPGVFCAARK